MSKWMWKIRKLFWDRKKKRLPPNVKDWSQKDQIEGLMLKYERLMGRRFDFNNPQLFTEKLQRYKILYDRTDFPDVVDKYLFKEYIRGKLGDGYTIPLYGAWETLDGFVNAWDGLPESFVLKSTLQSDGKCIRIIRDKSSVNFDELKEEVREWLKPEKTLINSYCRAYQRATPRILAEEYMTQVDNQLYDYKVFCFGGKPFCFYVATDHFPGQLSHISFYDLDWNKLDVRYGKHPQCDVEKPQHFDEMLELAGKLSHDFPFVRIDFFEGKDKPLLAELTLYPGAGETPYHPESFNRKMGELFRLPV